MTDSRARRTLDAALRVQDTLALEAIKVTLIGAAALAEYRYPRSTADLDFGSCVHPFQVLPRGVEALKRKGIRASLEFPDAEDPLGGVIHVTGANHDPIQVVNFLNPLADKDAAKLMREGIDRSHSIAGTAFRVVPLEHLIALKLYAGGAKSILDVAELLKRNPELELEAVRRVCARHGLTAELAAVTVLLAKG